MALLKLGWAGPIAHGKGHKCRRNPFVTRVNQERAGQSDFEGPVLTFGLHILSFYEEVRVSDSGALLPV